MNAVLIGQRRWWRDNWQWQIVFDCREGVLGTKEDRHSTHKRFLFPSPSGSLASWAPSFEEGMWEHLWQFSLTRVTSENLSFYKIQRECAKCLFVQGHLLSWLSQKCWCVLPFKIAQTDSWAAVTSGPVNALPLTPLLAMFLGSHCVLKSEHIFFF